MNRLTREWLRKADGDRTSARACADLPRPPRDAVCFHCQQTAEKCLKAVLQELGLPVPRTHDLEALLGSLALHHPSLTRLKRGLVFLTQYAVETRYPGKNATKRQMEAALRWAERVRDACRVVLGVRSRGKRSS